MTTDEGAAAVNARARVVAFAARLAAVALPAALLVAMLPVGFALGTDCTNNYSCSSTWCSPCRVMNLWLVGGVAALLVLLAVAAGLWVPRWDRGRTRTRTAGLALGVVLLATASFSVSAIAAGGAYCQPGDRAERGGDDYCATDGRPDRGPPRGGRR